MIRENLVFIFENWLQDKKNSTKILSENRAFNAALKPGSTSKKSYSLYDLNTAEVISTKIPELFYRNCGLPKTKYKIKGSIGQGNPAEIPWICVFDTEITTSAQVGFYIVYLFDAKMRGVYLSLNQGWTQYEREYGIKEGKIQIKRNANFAKSLLFSDQGFSYAPINLNANSTLGKGYEEGNICSKFYPSNNIPNEDELIDDLRNLVGVYRELKGHVGPNILEIKGKIKEELFQEEIQKGKRKELQNGKVEKKDKKLNSSSSSWTRDSNISFTSLDNANFNCENNIEHSTFISARTGRQFVEAHHLIPMEYQDDFKFSIDIPENIISLCPNCHRAFHNSTDENKLELIKKFIEMRSKKLSEREIAITEKQLLSYYKAINNIEN